MVLIPAPSSVFSFFNATCQSSDLIIAAATSLQMSSSILLHGRFGQHKAEYNSAVACTSFNTVLRSVIISHDNNTAADGSACPAVGHLIRDDE